MGELMRHYWIPFAASSELPLDRASPIRVRLLGENLVAYRLNGGEVGLIQDACPHRAASFFLGRNEGDGIRCIYHGWKFDREGTCVDMPSEPADSNFKNKVRARTYPCQERGGLIWTFMGKATILPPLPDIEANASPDAAVTQQMMRKCNYMQALEGGFLYATLHDPNGGAGRQRLDWQFTWSGTHGSARQVLSTPGTLDNRLAPDPSGFANLFLAGDWTRNGINAASAESAAVSGFQAAAAIAGR